MRGSAYRRRSLGERLNHISEAMHAVGSRPEALTDGARRLLGCLRDLLAVIHGSLDDRWEALEVVDAQDREDLRRKLCDDFQDVVRELAEMLLPALTGASAQLVPVELETVVRDAAARAAPDWQITPVLHGSQRYDYSIERVMDPVVRWAESFGVEPAAGDAHGDFVFLSVPSVERDSAPLHAVLIGHELGHLRDWYHEVSKTIEAPLPDAYVDAAGQLSLDHAVEADTYGDVVRGWSAELVADTFACLIMGPVALLALPELASSTGPVDIDYRTHPGTDRRLRLMLDVLVESGFDQVASLAEVFAEYFEDTAQAWDRPVDLGLGDLDEAGQYAWETLRAQIATVIHSCTEHLAPEELFRSTNWEGVEWAAECLKAGLPCGERVLPDGTVEEVSVTAILNACWLTKLAGLDALADEIGYDLNELDGLNRTNQVLDGLTLKSIEISQFRSRLGG